MRMTGRWVRRGATVVVLGVERELTFEGPFTFEVAAFPTTTRPTLRVGF
jgi:hypothetical protein